MVEVDRLIHQRSDSSPTKGKKLNALQELCRSGAIDTTYLSPFSITTPSSYNDDPHSLQPQDITYLMDLIQKKNGKACAADLAHLPSRHDLVDANGSPSSQLPLPKKEKFRHWKLFPPRVSLFAFTKIDQT
jgi:hypothetical protein